MLVSYTSFGNLIWTAKIGKVFSRVFSRHKRIGSRPNGAELHDDFKSLQSGICRWLDEGAQAPALAADEIARRYHPKVIAGEHLKIYREVLGR